MKRPFYWRDAGEDADDGCVCLIIPAECIDHELDTVLSELSRWQAADESNVRNGMWHWHWTIPLAKLPLAELYLTDRAELTRTFDIEEVW